MLGSLGRGGEYCRVPGESVSFYCLKWKDCIRGVDRKEGELWLLESVCGCEAFMHIDSAQNSE